MTIRGARIVFHKSLLYIEILKFCSNLKEPCTGPRTD
jgi:hypothetical protein